MMKPPKETVFYRPRRSFWQRLHLGRGLRWSRSRTRSTEASASDNTHAPLQCKDNAASEAPCAIPAIKSTVPPMIPPQDEELPDENRTNISLDLWSAACREAIKNLGKDVDSVILKASSIAQLLENLQNIDTGTAQESAFTRGLQHLRRLRVPLERLKLALDVAAPFNTVEPTASFVVGVVRSVTAFAISLASVDLVLAKQIGLMLEHMSYIDDCDTLGQEIGKEDIFRALVLVYQNILEFYQAAFEMLNRKGLRLVVQIAIDNERLPGIIKDFLNHAEVLRKLIEKATLEIVAEIKQTLYDQEAARYLGSDRLGRQVLHQTQLRDIRSDNACDFLLREEKFLDWYSGQKSQQLIIFGDTGRGKTLLMSYLVDTLPAKAKIVIPQPKLCYYFCQDDETGQMANILPCLVLGLLQQLVGLKKAFINWYKERQSDGIPDPVNDVDQLENFFLDTLATLDRPVFILIDGLDECPPRSRTRLLRLFDSSSLKAARTKVIMFSRPKHEIVIQVNGIPSIYLTPDRRRDALIATKTVEQQLLHLDQDLRALVIEKISDLAQGCAIWTRMIVQLIHVRGIHTLVQMQSFWRDPPLPEQLTKLYETLFSRCTGDDDENKDILDSALSLLSVVQRPLSLAELACAVTLSLAPSEVQSVAALSELVDCQRILYLAQPFLVRVEHGDIHKRQVKLNHQSIKEFVVRTSHLRGKPGTQYTETSTAELVAGLEARVLGICIRYLLLREIGETGLFSEALEAIEQLPPSKDIFIDSSVDSAKTHSHELAYNDPAYTWDSWEEDMAKYNPVERGFGNFFVYASCHWTNHFAMAGHTGLPKLSDLEQLCQARSIRLHNWTKQHTRPNCTIQERFSFDGDLYDPLSITALYGSDAMLESVLANANLRSDVYLPNSRARAAEHICQWGDQFRLDRLLCD